MVWFQKNFDVRIVPTLDILILLQCTLLLKRLVTQENENIIIDFGKQLILVHKLVRLLKFITNLTFYRFNDSLFIAFTCCYMQSDIFTRLCHSSIVFDFFYKNVEVFSSEFGGFSAKII